MSTYLMGCRALSGSRAAHVIGDLIDTSDYDNGQKLAIQMNTIFNALGRPKEFEARAMAIWAAYQNAQTYFESFNLLKQSHGTAMKQVGADAAALIADLQRAYPGKLAGNSPTLASSVYQPGTDKPSESFWSKIPTWGWAVGGVGAVGLLGVLFLPLVTAVISARSASRSLGH